MPFVLDASIAAAWFLPDEQHEAADRLMAELRHTNALVPSLFWFETRNLFLMAERRGRLRAGEALLSMTQLRGFPLDDMGSVGDAAVIDLASCHMLSAYDASYLALAKAEAVPLATGDRKLAEAARREGVPLLDPLVDQQ